MPRAAQLNMEACHHVETVLGVYKYEIAATIILSVIISKNNYELMWLKKIM